MISTLGKVKMDQKLFANESHEAAMEIRPYTQRRDTTTGDLQSRKTNIKDLNPV